MVISTVHIYKTVLFSYVQFSTSEMFTPHDCHGYFTAMMAAAATIQMESSGSVETPAQDQPNPALTSDNVPHSYPHRHGRHGWWSRQWRPAVPPSQPVDPPTATDLSEAVQHQQKEGPSTEDNQQAAWPGRRHGGPRFWHPDRRLRVGEVIVDGKSHEHGDFVPYRMAGYHGHRYPCFRHNWFQGGPENTYIFREFDFL